MSELMTQWEKERAERDKANETYARELYSYAREIAQALGDGWTVRPADPERDWTTNHPHLVKADTQAEFWIGADWRNKQKLSVHCNWPKDPHTGREQQPYFSMYSDVKAAPSIGFSRSKSAAVVARDIAKRFLPVFLPLWDKQAALVARLHDGRLTRTALAKQIATLLGGTVNGPRYDGDDRPASVHLGYRTRGIASVDFDLDPTALKVEIRCTFAELQQLATMFPVQDDDTEA